MRLAVVILGFFILVVGIFSFLLIESFGPTIWVLYPWLGFPNPFWFLRPLAFVFIVFGGILAAAGFIINTAKK